MDTQTQSTAATENNSEGTSINSEPLEHSQPSPTHQEDKQLTQQEEEEFQKWIQNCLEIDQKTNKPPENATKEEIASGKYHLKYTTHYEMIKPDKESVKTISMVEEFILFWGEQIRVTVGVAFIPEITESNLALIQKHGDQQYHKDISYKKIIAPQNIDFGKEIPIGWVTYKLIPRIIASTTEQNLEYFTPLARCLLENMDSLHEKFKENTKEELKQLSDPNLTDDQKIAILDSIKKKHAKATQPKPQDNAKPPLKTKKPNI